MIMTDDDEEDDNGYAIGGKGRVEYEEEPEYYDHDRIHTTCTHHQNDEQNLEWEHMYGEYDGEDDGCCLDSYNSTSSFENRSYNEGTTTTTTTTADHHHQHETVFLFDF